ncbi:MAG: iron-containing alcohol dehydrogenase [Lachnospiraceae bacterium]|nr:iron-containing alcohol dehydrogenase [Lachnospiraceae bacterium]MBQ4303657.1 iron-containing alcohol dehydrogenase [Lachnospiraceae bacterium]
MNTSGLPVHLLVEEGVYERIPEVAADILGDIGARRSLVLTQYEASEKYPQVVETITGAFERAEVRLSGTAFYEDALSFARYITGGDIRMVFAFGDTDLLNLAKYAGYMAGVPVVCIALTLDSDSIAAPAAVLRPAEGKARKAYNCAVPAAVLVDVDIVSRAPELELKAGTADVISKFSALYDWRLAEARNHDRVNDFAYMMTEMALNSVRFSEDSDLTGRDSLARLAEALIMCGLSVQVADTFAPVSGSEHTFAYALETYYADQVQIPRGIAAAMGTYASAVFQDRPVDRFCQLIKKYQIQIKPSSWGIDKELFAGAWLKAAHTRPDLYTVLYETHMNENKLHAIYDEMELVL